MASIKVQLYTHKELSNGEHPIVIQVIKDRKRKLISLGQSCSKSQWNFQANLPSRKHPHYKELELLIEKKKAEAKGLVINLDTEKKDFTLSEFERRFRNKGKRATVLQFIDKITENLQRANRIGNSLVYKDLKRVLLKFKQGTDLSFPEIDHSFLNRLEQYFREEGLKETSISLYFRTLRAVVNKAIKEGFAKKSDYPFEEFKISGFNVQTVKRAISKSDISRIIELIVEEGSSLYHAKNYFLFSFYAMGMNFSDLAFLRWEDISGDRIYYTRAKTGKNYNVKILRPAQLILDYYKQNRTNKYVFPILDDSIHKTQGTIINRIKKVRKQVNSDLKVLAGRAEISVELTTYVARHTWATILKRSGVSTSIISEGLGHFTEKTTQVYLDSFENETIDKANEMLLTI